MKIKAAIVSAIFIVACFAGPVMAAEHEAGAKDMSKGAGKDMPTGMHKASDLMGKTVVSQQGKELGSIENLIVSENGQIEFIVLARGGTLGMGENMVPIPWQAANLQMQQDQLVASIDETKLQDAPSFEADNWGQFDEQEVHGYYGTQSQGKDSYQQQTSPGQDPMKSQETKEKKGY